MATRYTLGEDAKKDFDRLRKAPIKVPGGRLAKRMEQDDSTVWIKITGALHFGGQGPYQWTYQGILQAPDTSVGNAGQFVDVVDSDDEPVQTDMIYNTCEANNTASGVQGNSINSATLPAGFSIQPIRGYPVLPARKVTMVNGDPAYLVTYPNAVDGVCQ